MVTRRLMRPNSFGSENIILEFSPHREERILSEEVFDMLTAIMELRSYDVYDAIKAVANSRKQIIGDIREHKTRCRRVIIAEG